MPQITFELLKQVPLLSQLSRESLEALMPCFHPEQFAADDLIFAEGQRGDRFYIVLEGAVQIAREIGGVGEEQISMCRFGDYFGEISVLDGAPRTANARAMESTAAVSLRKTHLEERMFADSELAKELLWVFTRHLSVRLRETNEKLRALHQMNM